MGEEIALAHIVHLDGEEEEGEGVDVEEGVAVADLQQVGQFEKLHDVDDAHGALGGEELFEMLAVGLRLPDTLEQPPIEMCDDKGQIGRKQNQICRVGCRHFRAAKILLFFNSQ